MLGNQVQAGVDWRWELRGSVGLWAGRGGFKKVRCLLRRVGPGTDEIADTGSGFGNPVTAGVD